LKRNLNDRKKKRFLKLTDDQQIGHQYVGRGCPVAAITAAISEHQCGYVQDVSLQISSADVYGHRVLLRINEQGIRRKEEFRNRRSVTVQGYAVSGRSGTVEDCEGANHRRHTDGPDHGLGRRPNRQN